MDWLDIIHAGKNIPGHEAVIYNLGRPIAKKYFRKQGLEVVPDGNIARDGPVLLVAPHLFATDPISVALATPKRLVSLYERSRYGRQGYEMVHVSAILTGIDVRSLDFTEEVYNAWNKDMPILVFPEGDMPRKIRAHHINSCRDTFNPREYPVSRWDQRIFEMVKVYQAFRGVPVICQPVGLDYGDSVRYKNGHTFPGNQTIHVRFGEPIKSDEMSATALSHAVMSRAAELSGRKYDDQFSNRLRNSKK